MNANTPASKSQKRAAALLNITIRDSYMYAAETLKAAGVNETGIPAGHDWRSASKLSDSELLAKLTVTEEKLYVEYE